MCVASRMLLLHMQEIVFVDSQEGLLSSRGGEGAQTYWHQAYSIESQMVQYSPGFHRRVIIKTPFS